MQKLMCVNCSKQKAADNSMCCLDCEIAAMLVQMKEPPAVLHSSDRWLFETVEPRQTKADPAFRVLGALLLIFVALFAWTALYEWGGAYIPHFR